MSTSFLSVYPRLRWLLHDPFGDVTRSIPGLAAARLAAVQKSDGITVDEEHIPQVERNDAAHSNGQTHCHSQCSEKHRKPAGALSGALRISRMWRIWRIWRIWRGLQPNLNRLLSMCRALILCSSVDGGIRSLAAAPDGPDTRPLLAASAASMILRSLGAFSRPVSSASACGEDLVLSTCACGAAKAHS